jgi:hypothetical protein
MASSCGSQTVDASMNPATKELLAAVRALPANERQELLRTLVDEEASDEFDQELDRRSAEMDDGTDPGMSLDEFLRRSRQILESN